MGPKFAAKCGMTISPRWRLGAKWKVFLNVCAKGCRSTTWMWAWTDKDQNDWFWSLVLIHIKIRKSVFQQQNLQNISYYMIASLSLRYTALGVQMTDLEMDAMALFSQVDGLFHHTLVLTLRKRACGVNNYSTWTSSLDPRPAGETDLVYLK